MAHLIDYNVYLTGQEGAEDTMISSSVVKEQAEAVYKRLLDAGQDAFVDQIVVWLDEQMIVNEIMRGAIGDLVFGTMERRGPGGEFDCKHGLFRPDEYYEAKDSPMLAYMEVDKISGEVRWKLTADGIQHYLENYDIKSESLRSKLIEYSNARADWTNGYVARLYMGQHSKPSAKSGA